MTKRVRQYLLLPSFVALSAILAACASDPIVNRTGVDPKAYQRDLNECESYADQVRVAAKAGTGTVAGAAVGAVIGVIVGDTRTGAGVGAVQGGASGTLSGVRERRTVVRNCLRDKGYRVYN